MERLSVRINNLISGIDQKHRALFKNMIECDMKSAVITKLKDDFSCSEQEANQIIYFICNDIEHKHENKAQSNYAQLIVKQNKILNIQHKLKVLNRFKHRDNLGEKGQLNIDIGNEINELEFSIDHATIDIMVDKLIIYIGDIEKIKKKLNDDANLFKLNVASFCTKIDEENNKKKERISSENNNNKNEKKKKNKSISNNKSHVIVAKYSQLMDAESVQYNLLDELDELAKEIKYIATNLGIFVNGDKCPQEARWKNVANNEHIVSFKGEKAYNRIKNLLREIQGLKKKCNENIETLKLLTNETVWKKQGRLKSKDTLRERVQKYNEEKKKRNKKNAEKTRAKNANKQKQKQNDNLYIPPLKKQKTLDGFVRKG